MAPTSVTMTGPIRRTWSGGSSPLPDTATNRLGIPVGQDLPTPADILRKVQCDKQWPRQQPVFVAPFRDIDPALARGLHRRDGERRLARSKVIRLTENRTRETQHSS